MNLACLDGGLCLLVLIGVPALVGWLGWRCKSGCCEEQ